MSNVRVVFRKHAPGALAALIRLWTRSPYSHCEIVFTDGSWFSSDPTGTRHTRFLVPGPAINPADYDTVAVPMTDADESRMREWCVGEAGCAYDWLGIFFSQLINFGWHTRNRYFCGEVCTAALQVGGLPFSLQPQRYAPGDLFTSITTKRP